MSSNECLRFKQGWDGNGDAASEDRLSSEQADHLAGCPACREYTETLEGIRTAVAEHEIDPLTRRRVVVAVTAAEKEQTRRPTGRQALVLLPLAAAAAVAFFLALPSEKPAPKRPTAPAEVATSAPAPEKAPDAPLAPVRTTHDGRRVVSLFTGTSLWLAGDTVVEPRHEGDDLARFWLESGRVVAEVGAHRPGFRFIIATPAGEVEARGTLFSVEVESETVTRASVVEGTVELRPSGGDAAPLVLTAGQTALVGAVDATPMPAETEQRDRCLALGECASDEKAPRLAASRPPRATAPNQAAAEAELARSYRRKREFDAAAETYRRLIERFPTTEAATNGLVALAQIELKALGDPRAALGHFDDYLSINPRGYLSEAARAGRVRAHSKLGDDAGTARAATDYLDAHRGGLFVAEMLCKRGDARVRSGNCPRAVSDYQRVISEWPGSREAVRASRGLGACGETPEKGE